MAAVAITFAVVLLGLAFVAVLHAIYGTEQLTDEGNNR
jgi:hypothetical protein